MIITLNADHLPDECEDVVCFLDECEKPIKSGELCAEELYSITPDGNEVSVIICITCYGKTHAAS